MNCLKTSIENSLEHAYAHHIQRLMITGNFALLLQTNPDEVDHWYLGIYADAVEWVQLPNTRGMSQYADGGILATKPYVSSGSYVNKMSNYCKGCSYDKKQRTGENACPFNSLYWNFLDDKREELRGNNRMGMMYNLLGKSTQKNWLALKKGLTKSWKIPMHSKKEINVFWFKRDLRLLDNEGLQDAINSGLPLLLLYVMEPSLEKNPPLPQTTS